MFWFLGALVKYFNSPVSVFALSVLYISLESERQK